MNIVKRTSLSRRTLLKLAAVQAVPWIVPASAIGRGRTAPSERLQIGVVGLSTRGVAVLTDFLKHDDVQVVAVCDVQEVHHRELAVGKGPAFGRGPVRKLVETHYAAATRQGQFTGCAALGDYRELCARPDLDAIIVATPDHWHATITLTALRHGKDVYCEKPITHDFAEGQAVYREVARRRAILQVGSQQRSEANFRRAVEIVRNGHLGAIQRVEVGLPPGYTQPQGDPTPKPPPAGLDYDFWCGPAPQMPYLVARHHRWWRGHRAYGGGVLMDFIGHHNDIAHWGLDVDRSGPSRVEAVNWVYPQTDVYDTPAAYDIICDYAGGIRSTISSRLPLGTKWIGEQGWIWVNRGKSEASEPRWLDPAWDCGPWKAYASDDHTRNFLDGVRHRRECVAPAETGHRSITPGHLAYVSQALQRPLRWDPVNETVIGDAEAQQRLRAVQHRAPWAIELT